MNQPTTNFATPVSQEERITILDSLRGIAILGVLLMNIPGFGMPEVQTSNPALFNETGINYKWFVVDWALSGTQRAFFSMLFGAGIILFISRLEKKASGMEPAIYFFRRNLWLLAFGMFNAFVLERYELYIYTGIVWLIEIIWSHIWLRYYQFGPLEWAWRQLTYWKRLPIRKPGLTDK